MSPNRAGSPRRNTPSLRLLLGRGLQIAARFCYHTYPSLKHPDDQKALWDRLVNDGFSTTATDEYPTSLELKLRGKEIDDVIGGNLGAEARMGIIYTEGVVKRGITLQRFVEVTSTNAAKILGLLSSEGRDRTRQRCRSGSHRPINQQAP